MPAVRAFVRIFAPRRGEIVIDAEALGIRPPKGPGGTGSSARAATEVAKRKAVGTRFSRKDGGAGRAPVPTRRHREPEPVGGTEPAP